MSIAAGLSCGARCGDDIAGVDSVTITTSKEKHRHKIIGRKFTGLRRCLVELVPAGVETSARAVLDAQA